MDTIAEAGEELAELVPNVRMIQDDNTQNALLNGEASVAFLYTSQVTAALAENPDLKVVYPEEDRMQGVYSTLYWRNHAGEGFPWQKAETMMW